MKLLIKKERKTYVEDLRREVTVQKPEKHLVKDTTKDFFTQFGPIKKESFIQPDGTVIALGNQEYTLLTPSMIDMYKTIDRSAQIIPLKDIGPIITTTGINKETTILDSGSGSGGLSLFLAMIAKKVTTYDIKPENTEIVQKNIKMLGLKNITAKTANIYDFDTIEETDIDVFTLDVPEPGNAIKTAEKTLKMGGFIVCYSPCIPPLSEFIEAVRKSEKLTYIKTIEILERDWEFDGRKIRPESQQIGHSGFLAFARKI